MRLSLFILLAGLSLACSTPETNDGSQAAATSETAPVPSATTVAATEQQPAITATEAPVEAVPQRPENNPVQPAANTNIQKQQPSTTEVELKTGTPSSTPRPTGPTIKESATPAPPPPTTGKPVVVEEDAPTTTVVKTEPDHSIWDNILRNFVSSTGQVNYRSLKNSSTTLDGYLEELQTYPPQNNWERNQIMAYWINAYNAYTIKLIIDNYPVNSIKDIHGGDPWNKKWIKIGGSTYSLNQIENDILRARYGDARIHFAVNCAAASCPPLYNRAFTASNLNSTLQRLTRSFVNNSSYNTLSSAKIEISKIFEWYAGDFGNVKSYIDGFTDVEIGANTQVSYKEYNWALNGK